MGRRGSADKASSGEERRPEPVGFGGRRHAPILRRVAAVGGARPPPRVSLLLGQPLPRRVEVSRKSHLSQHRPSLAPPRSSLHHVGPLISPFTTFRFFFFPFFFFVFVVLDCGVRNYAFRIRFIFAPFRLLIIVNTGICFCNVYFWWSA